MYWILHEPLLLLTQLLLRQDTRQAIYYDELTESVTLELSRLALRGRCMNSVRITVWAKIILLRRSVCHGCYNAFTYVNVWNETENCFVSVLFRFYPRDAVISRCSIETTGRIGLIFWRGGFFRSVLHCVIRKFRYLQKKVYFPLEFFLNSGLLVYHRWSSRSVYSTIPSRQSVSDSWYLLFQIQAPHKQKTLARGRELL